MFTARMVEDICAIGGFALPEKLSQKIVLSAKPPWNFGQSEESRRLVALVVYLSGTPGLSDAQRAEIALHAIQRGRIPSRPSAKPSSDTPAEKKGKGAVHREETERLPIVEAADAAKILFCVTAEQLLEAKFGSDPDNARVCRRLWRLYCKGILSVETLSESCLLASDPHEVLEHAYLLYCRERDASGRVDVEGSQAKVRPAIDSALLDPVAPSEGLTSVFAPEFVEFLDNLKDREARRRVEARVERVCAGGSARMTRVRTTVSELYVFNPPLRILFTLSDNGQLVFLTGGSKNREQEQTAYINDAEKIAARYHS